MLEVSKNIVLKKISNHRLHRSLNFYVHIIFLIITQIFLHVIWLLDRLKNFYSKYF